MESHHHDEVSHRFTDGYFEDQNKPTWLAAVNVRIREILDLREGWSGPNSHPVQRTTLEALLDALGKLQIPDNRPPHLTAHFSGGVQAEWRLGDKSIEVGAAPDGELFAFVVENEAYALAVENSQRFEDETFQQLTSYLHDLGQGEINTPSGAGS